MQIPTDPNQKLPILYDMLVDNYETTSKEIVALIAQPEKIEDTNKFTSLLSRLNDTQYITPLLQQINKGEIKNWSWLGDYIYAAVNLVDDAEGEFDVPDGLTEKLIRWMLEHTGEVAWYAASLLKFSVSDDAKQALLKKLTDDDFFLAHKECIKGLLWHDKAKYMSLVYEIAADETKHKDFREWCNSIIERTG